MDKNNLVSPHDTIISLSQKKWKDAFRTKALLFSLSFDKPETTIGYRVFFYLWSADVWFGRFPLLKFIVAVNIVVWIVLFVF